MALKDFELLLAKARPRAGQVYTTKQLLITFNYSPTTYIRDTQLYSRNLIAHVQNGWIILPDEVNKQ